MMPAMRVLLAFSAVLFAVATMAISTCGSSAPAPTASPSPPAVAERTPIPPPTFGPIDTGRTPIPIPGGSALTNDQMSQIEAIVRADPELAQIVDDVSYTLVEFGPWYGDTDPATGEASLIGGVTTIGLSTPIAHVEHDFKVRSPRPYYAAWPAEAKAKYAPYTETTEHKSIDNLRRLYAFVDLQKNDVAYFRVETEYGQTVSIAQPGPTPQFTQGASPEAKDIFNRDPRVTALLAGLAYTTADQYTSLYTIGTTHLASIIAALQDPQEIEGDWLILLDFDQQTGDYTNEVIHFKAKDVQAVGVTIDLDTGKVAWVEPDQHFND